MKIKLNSIFYVILVTTQLNASVFTYENTGVARQIYLPTVQPHQITSSNITLSQKDWQNPDENAYKANLRGTKLNSKKDPSSPLTGSIDYILLAGQNLTNTTNPTEYPTVNPSTHKPTAKPSLSPAEKRALKKHKAYVNGVKHQDAALGGIFGTLGGLFCVACCCCYPCALKNGKCCPSEYEVTHAEPENVLNGCAIIGHQIQETGRGIYRIGHQCIQRPTQPAQVPAQEREFTNIELDAGLR